MGFFDDFGEGFIKPFEWGYNKLTKADKLLDNTLDGASGLLGGISDLLSGKSNFFLYIGLGIVAVAILPKIIEKVI